MKFNIFNKIEPGRNFVMCKDVKSMFCFFIEDYSDQKKNFGIVANEVMKNNANVVIKDCEKLRRIMLDPNYHMHPIVQKTGKALVGLRRYFPSFYYAGVIFTDYNQKRGHHVVGHFGYTKYPSTLVEGKFGRRNLMLFVDGKTFDEFRNMPDIEELYECFDNICYKVLFVVLRENGRVEKWIISPSVFVILQPTSYFFRRTFFGKESKETPIHKFAEVFVEELSFFILVTKLAGEKTFYKWRNNGANFWLHLLTDKTSSSLLELYKARLTFGWIKYGGKERE